MPLSIDVGALIAAGIATAGGIFTAGHYVGIRRLNGFLHKLTTQMEVLNGRVERMTQDIERQQQIIDNIWGGIDGIRQNYVRREDCREFREAEHG